MRSWQRRRRTRASPKSWDADFGCGSGAGGRGQAIRAPFEIVGAAPASVLLKMQAGPALQLDPSSLEEAVRMLLLRCAHVTLRTLAHFLRESPSPPRLPARPPVRRRRRWGPAQRLVSRAGGARAGNNRVRVAGHVTLLAH